MKLEINNRVLRLLLIALLRRQRAEVQHMTRIKAATCYVRGVQQVRRSVLGYLALGLLRYLFGLGVLLLHIGLVIYLPWKAGNVGLLLLALGGFYALAALAVIGFMMSERIWMKASNAAQTVDRAIRNQPLFDDSGSKND
jgi:hypothetical protein